MEPAPSDIDPSSVEVVETDGPLDPNVIRKVNDEPPHPHDLPHRVGMTSHEKKDFYCKLVKLVSMLIMVFGYFLVELVVGFVGNSLSLVSDAFHMMSDSLSLVVGLTALLLTLRRKSPSFSYGWARAEILGGLVNSVFLLSVVFFIYTEAIQRAFEVEPIDNPWLVLIVGAVGLAINIVGLVIFGHHHDHSHDHDEEEGHSHSHSHDEASSDAEHSHSHSSKKSFLTRCCHNHDHGDEKKKKKGPGRSMNMVGVLLHVFGDFLGSIAVLIAVGINLGFPPEGHYVVSDDGLEVEAICTKNCFVPYVDPICSAVLATIMLITTVPLFLKSAKILMQTVPKNIDLVKLHNEIEQISGVGGVHDLHVWRLVSNRVICSMHLTCPTDSDFMPMAKEIQSVLHRYEIHSSTIQPEFDKILILRRNGEEMCSDATDSRCVLRCVEDSCSPMACCPDSTYLPSPKKGDMVDVIDVDPTNLGRPQAVDSLSPVQIETRREEDGTLVVVLEDLPPKRADETEEEWIDRHVGHQFDDEDKIAFEIVVDRPE